MHVTKDNVCVAESVHRKQYEHVIQVLFSCCLLIHWLCTEIFSNYQVHVGAFIFPRNPTLHIGGSVIFSIAAKS